jgi:hypothetical protein
MIRPERFRTTRSQHIGEQQRKAANERLERLRWQCKALVEAAEKTADGLQQSKLLDRYFRWMTENDLDDLRRNVNEMTQRSGLSASLKNSASINKDPSPMAKAIANMIRDTQLE